jgi:hypothetical protein
MLRRTHGRLVRNPVPDDTKAFYSWFSAQTYRQERMIPGGYPAVKVYPVYGKRWMSGKTFTVFMSGLSIIGAWLMPDKERWNHEIEAEWHERQAAHIPYQQSEIHLRYLVTAYKRHKYEQENLVDKGYVGLTSEFRKFFYHDDCWRPALHDVFRHNNIKYGGPFLSYNWATGYW